MIWIVNFFVDCPLIKLWKYYFRAVFGGDVDENSARRNEDFSLLRSSASSNRLTGMTKASWCVD